MPIRTRTVSTNREENFYIIYSPIRNQNLSFDEIKYADNIIKIRGCPLGIRNPEEINQVNSEFMNFYIIIIDYINTCLQSDEYLQKNYEVLIKRVLIKKEYMIKVVEY